MTTLFKKPHSKYHNYMKTRWHPDHLAVLWLFHNIKYSKFKNKYVDYSEMRIPTSLGYIEIEHNISAALKTDTIVISMVFIKSSIRHYIYQDAKSTVIENLIDE